MRLFVVLVLFFTISGSFAQSGKYFVITPEHLEEEVDEVFADVSAKIIFRKIYVEIGKSLEVREARKIYNTGGLSYSDFEIPYDNVKIKKAVTHNLIDGEVVRTEVSKESIFKDKVSKNFEINKVVFPNVKEGSVIEIVYTVDDIALWTINYQDALPIKNFRLEIVKPNVYMGFTISKNGFAKVDLEAVEENGVLVYKGVNIPALKIENFLGSVNNYLGRLYFEPSFKRHRGQKWVDISSFYYNSEINKSSYFKKDLAVVLGNEEDPLKKAKLVYDFLQKRMKWNEYYGTSTYDVKKIYKSKEGPSGDINMLLVAMLKKSGLDAQMMKIAGKRKGLVHFPSFAIFNNTVCALKINGEHYLLDASQSYARFGDIPLAFVNGDGLVITGNKSCYLLSTQARLKSQKTIHAEVDLDIENFSVKGKVKRRMSGYYAWEHREAYEGIDMDNYVSALESEHNLLSVSNFQNKDFDKLDAPVSMFYDFELEDYLEEISDEIYFDPLLYFGKTENSFTDEERIFPIDFGFPFSRKIQVIYNFPEEYDVHSLPETIKIAIPDGVGALSFECLAKESTVAVTLNLDIHKGMVETKYYPAIRKVFSELITVTNSKIVLTRNN